MNIKYFLPLLILLSTLFPKIDSKVKKLNAKIEDIYFQFENYDFPDNYKKIDELIKECSEIEYLYGELQLIGLKMDQALALGKEETLYDWDEEYEKQIKQYRNR